MTASSSFEARQLIPAVARLLPRTMTMTSARLPFVVPQLRGESPASFREPFSRRDMLGMSLAGLLGVSFSGWLPRLAAAAEGSGKKTKSVILLWMSGGPSQMDTFDLKPGHANGGTFKEIATAAPGVRISEHLPLLAKEMNDLAIIRS